MGVAGRVEWNLIGLRPAAGRHGLQRYDARASFSAVGSNVGAPRIDASNGADSLIWEPSPSPTVSGANDKSVQAPSKLPLLVEDTSARRDAEANVGHGLGRVIKFLLIINAFSEVHDATRDTLLLNLTNTAVTAHR